jgi:hypothetical protein
LTGLNEIRVLFCDSRTMPTAFKCPHCKTEYEVAYSVGPLETGSQNCDSCGKQMDSWSNARRPVYARKPQSDDGKQTS